jgi:2-methylisocitrate lyase-like PEP mutase family enzyme
MKASNLDEGQLSPVLLRKMLADSPIVIVPGVYDAMSAAIAENAGFKALFVSGSALAAAHLGRPDIGLLSLPETAQIVDRISDRVAIPLLVDADQGGGNTFAVGRHVRMLEKAGAAAIQIEDQWDVKPSNAPLSRPVISTLAMVDKIKAAKDACHKDTIISARSDAASTHGAEAAIERACAYADAGADMVFVESLQEREDMLALIAAIGGRVPILHNLLRPNEAANDAKTLEEMGYSIVLFPTPAIQGAQSGLADALAKLKNNPSVKDAGSSPDYIGAADFFAGK